MLVQGWAESGHWVNSLLKVLLERIPGVKVVVVDYLIDAKGQENPYFHSHMKVEEYANIVKMAYIQVQKDYPGITIFSVGHSLGGILLRYLCLEGLFPSRNMVLVGTPNEGIPYSFVGGRVVGLITCPLFYVLSSKWLYNVPLYRQLLWGSEFIKKLNEKRIPGDAHYIRGEKDLLGNSADPLGVGVSVKCDHHLVPSFGGKTLEELSTEEMELYSNSAIPEILRIIDEELVKIKARV